MVFGESENLAAFSFEEGDDADQYRMKVADVRAFSGGKCCDAGFIWGNAL